MYQVSRAIYRELAPHVSPPEPGALRNGAGSSHEQVLRSCEAVIRRLAMDPYCFADPTRTLFRDIRTHFPMTAQAHVHRVVSFYMGIAQHFIAEHPLDGYAAVSGEAPRCRATTRKGEACRRMPLPHNGYCPSHQHLADTEGYEWPQFRLTDSRPTGISPAAEVDGTGVSEGPGYELEATGVEHVDEDLIAV